MRQKQREELLRRIKQLQSRAHQRREQGETTNCLRSLPKFAGRADSAAGKKNSSIMSFIPLSFCLHSSLLSTISLSDFSFLKFLPSLKSTSFPSHYLCILFLIIKYALISIVCFKQSDILECLLSNQTVGT